jgi:Homeodomain-like domain
LLVVRGAPVLMVEADPARVEQALAAGELACPGCGGVLGGWGWARGRWLRGRGGCQQRVRPRRGRCRACRATHVLLPVTGLLRRLDLAEVIGAALLARAGQASLRRIAAALGVPLSTVRGWLGRFAARATLIGAHFTRLAAWFEPSVATPEPRGSPLERAVGAIGVAAVAAARRLGAHTGPFEFARGPVAGGCCATPTRPFRGRGSAGMLAGDVSPLRSSRCMRRGSADRPARSCHAACR